MAPLDDLVRGQYEHYVYPRPIEDLPLWLESNWQWFDPRHAHRMFWPDRDYPSGLDILVAGCGTSQAAVLAYTNPSAKVIGIDVSEASLAHQRRLADTYDLDNLELHHLPIERVDSLGRDFDLIVSTGVLHHLEDPDAGMAALASCLRRDGVLAVMLYARYGRVGVEMLQSAFRDLGLTQNQESITMVREIVAHLDADHPVGTYLGIAPDLGDDAGIVDTFLHGRERAYSIDECVALVEGAGLVFQDMFLKAPYYSGFLASQDLRDAISTLPREKQWSIVERLNPRNGCHFFLACRSDRPREYFEIDFSSDQALELIPEYRYRCSLTDSRLIRSDWSVDLDPRERALVQQIDGRRTIREIAAIVSAETGEPAPQAARYARELVQSLWELDFLAMGVSSP
ncbi:MAG: methyltransferase domain-containing protein [Actinobacteria bacterium]|nr:methyltransferase domain-containing protein [Actinomycetota bacterium]